MQAAENQIINIISQNNVVTVASFDPACMDAWMDWICVEAFRECRSGGGSTGAFTSKCGYLAKFPQFASIIPDCNAITSNDGNGTCYGSVLAKPAFQYPQCPPPLVRRPTLPPTSTNQSSNTTLASQSLLPPSVALEPLVTCIDTLQCCLPCPISKALYPRGRLERILIVTFPFRLISTLLSLFVVISYIFLPGRREHPKVLILYGSLGVFILQCGTLIGNLIPEKVFCSSQGPWGIDELNGGATVPIISGTQDNNLVCGIQSFMVIVGALTILTWVLIILVNMHLQTVWNNNILSKAYPFLHFFCFGVPLSIAAATLATHSSRYTHGTMCVIARSVIDRLLFLPAACIMVPAVMVHLCTSSWISFATAGKASVDNSRNGNGAGAGGHRRRKSNVRIVESSSDVDDVGKLEDGVTSGNEGKPGSSGQKRRKRSKSEVGAVPGGRLLTEGNENSGSVDSSNVESGKPSSAPVNGSEHLYQTHGVSGMDGRKSFDTSAGPSSGVLRATRRRSGSTSTGATSAIRGGNNVPPLPSIPPAAAIGISGNRGPTTPVLEFAGGVRPSMESSRTVTAITTTAWRPSGEIDVTESRNGLEEKTDNDDGLEIVGVFSVQVRLLIMAFAIMFLFIGFWAFYEYDVGILLSLINNPVLTLTNTPFEKWLVCLQNTPASQNPWDTCSDQHMSSLPRLPRMFGLEILLSCVGVVDFMIFFSKSWISEWKQVLGFKSKDDGDDGSNDEGQSVRSSTKLKTWSWTSWLNLFTRRKSLGGGKITSRLGGGFSRNQRAGGLDEDDEYQFDEMEGAIPIGTMGSGRGMSSGATSLSSGRVNTKAGR
ncbi:hypothetical protein HDU76_010124 [Blyttiomyces sp. JEL0837]|nr:hypothetical protein HDU76_010124 [Blyttiomyces sp. JEL0837]